MKTLKQISIIITFFIAILSTELFADGFIVIRPPRPVPNAKPFPLEVKYHHVNVSINGIASETKIDQEFYNPTGNRLEGYYMFPIPKGAVIKKFSMYINGKETQAELLDSKKARTIYEDIVRKMKDPALLEYIGQNLFKARIYPIEPYSTKRIKISYSQILNKDNNTVEYIYPLNTEKFSSKILKDVSVNIEIKSQINIKNVYCATHEAEIIRKNNKHSIISYEAKNIKPDKDFKVYYNTDNSKIGFSLLTYKDKGEDGYFLLSISPGINLSSNEIEEKDITFVLDTSGSMAGKKLKQAKNALNFCINNLNKNDRFQIIRFSTESEKLFSNMSIASSKNISIAETFINNLKPIGGTNIDEALTSAMQTNKSTRPHMIIFITDGKPTIGETNENRLLNKTQKNNLSNQRIFTFGIGEDINTHLLDKITKETRAYRTYISSEEDIEIKISNFYSKVQSPVLTNLKLKFSNNIRTSKLYPFQMPDLFYGDSLTVLGRYTGNGNLNIELTGNIKSKTEKYKFNSTITNQNLKNNFIPQIWASRRIGYLLDQIRLNGEQKEIIDEITDLARRHGIITPYTSYLILEDEKEQFARRSIDHEEKTLGAIAPQTSELINKSRKKYNQMRAKSGSGSIQASKDFQSLNRAMTSDQSKNSESLDYTDNDGNKQNLISQVKNISGRTFYFSGKFWVDSMVQGANKKKKIRIQFMSYEYFKLLKNKSLSAKFLSLGKNIRFMMNNVYYEVYE